MFDTLFSIFAPILVPSARKPFLVDVPIPSYPKTAEEAFRRDWEKIGGDMRKAMKKFETSTEHQQHPQPQGGSHGKHASS